MKKEILDAIDNHSTIIIHRHENPDPDALGSQAGLAEFIRANTAGKKVYITGEEEPSLTFLTEMDDVDDKSYDGALVIVCDTANKERISDDRYEKGATLIKIDHHPDEEPYGHISWVDTQFSSVSEMIVEFYLYAKEDKGWHLNEKAARLLYAGIVGDTGRFRFNNTTANTMRMAAELLEQNVDTDELLIRFYEKPESLLRFQGRVLQDFELIDGELGVMYITQSLLEECGITISESSASVNAFGELKGIKAWVFFVENEDGTYRVRLRSKGPVINDIAAEFNGGGHPMASGAKAESFDVTKQVITRLQERCQEYEG